MEERRGEVCEGLWWENRMEGDYLEDICLDALT
jgi:hypothetical protein